MEVEVSMTIVICSAAVLIVGIISAASCLACHNEDIRDKQKAESREQSAALVLRSKEMELGRLNVLLEKLLEKSPTISVKKES